VGFGSSEKTSKQLAMQGEYRGNIPHNGPVGESLGPFFAPENIKSSCLDPMREEGTGLTEVCRVGGDKKSCGKALKREA